MSKRSLALALLCVVGLGLTVWVLKQRNAGIVIARLTSVNGDHVERDRSDQLGSWAPAQPGAQFGPGDGLRTGPDATAKLQLIDASQLDVSPNSQLRFLLGGVGQANDVGIDVQTGEAMLRTGASDLHLDTHIGSFVVKAGTLVMLTREGEELGFDVRLGSLQFRDADGDQRTVAGGDAVHVAIGMAVLGASADQPSATETSGLLLDIQGEGSRLRAADQSTWQELGPGVRQVEPGSTLSLAVGGRAKLRRGRDSALLQGAGEYTLGVGDSLVSTNSGELALESVTADVRIEVPGGIIILRSEAGGGKARVRVDAKQGSLSVQRGRASSTLNGATYELTAGQEQSWNVDMGLADEGEDEGSALPTLEQPKHFNLSAPAGESFVLHAPEVPVSIQLDFTGKCPDLGEVQLSGSRQAARGAQKVNVLFQRGARAYTVRCVGAKGAASRAVARGNVTVLLDEGTRKLPPLPPTSLADADGRTYTLYYSNQPPALRLRWPNPPKQATYVLEVDGKPQNLTAPEYTFKSGELPDGSHTAAFRAGTRRSRNTIIEVRFDNHAATASVSQPANRGFTPGQAVPIAGVTLPSWKVSLNGGTIAEQAGGRFSGSIQTTPQQPDIAVRLSHPRRGVHYYLRRAAASP